MQGVKCAVTITITYYNAKQLKRYIIEYYNVWDMVPSLIPVPQNSFVLIDLI